MGACGFAVVEPGDLVVWRKLGVDLGDAGEAPRFHRHQAVVAGEDGAAESKVSDELGSLGPEPVAELNLADEQAVAVDSDLAVAACANGDFVVAEPAGEALAGDLHDGAGAVERDAAPAGLAEDGLGDGVAAGALERGCDAECLVGGGENLGATCREGSGLVEGDLVGLGEPEEDGPVSDEGSAACGGSDADGESRRRGKREGAGAGDDEHCDGGWKCCVEAVEPVPDGEGGGGGDERRNGEPGGNAVAEHLDRRAGRTGHLHESGEAGDEGVVAGGGNLALRGALRHGGAGGELFAGGAVGGLGFARDEREVEPAVAVDDACIDRDDGARADCDAVATEERADGDLFGARGGYPAGVGGHASEQRAGRELRGGAAPVLDKASAEEQGDEHGHGVEVAILAGEGGPGAVEVEQDDGDRDGHIHGERALAEACPGALVEGLCGVECSRGREQQDHPAEQGSVACLHALEPAEVDADGEQHHIHHGEGCDAEPSEEGMGGAGGMTAEAGLVAELLDAVGDGGERGGLLVPDEVGDAGAEGDMDLCDARQSAGAALDEPGAGGAAEAADLEVCFAAPIVAEGGALCEELGVVEARDIAGLGAGREAVAELVEAVPVGLGCEVGDGCAALAAEGAVAADNGGSRSGQRAAVEAGAISVCHVRSPRRRGRGSAGRGRRRRRRRWRCRRGSRRLQ